MFISVLTLHIVIAFGMGGAALLALRDIIIDVRSRLRPLALLLAWGLTGEIVTGSALALLATDGVSLVHFCQNIALYLVLTAAVEAGIFVRLRPFPLVPALAPVLPALCVATVTALSLV